jgi:hypothetical protein
MQTWDRHWRQNPLRSDPRAAVEERWLSIPRNVWHRPRIGPHADWMVISFHTAGAADLIEERARDDENPDAGSTSEAYAGRRSR